MTNYAPWARIFLRYIAALVVGADMGDTLAGDPDVVTVVAAAIAACTEAAYVIAKRKGWAT